MSARDRHRPWFREPGERYLRETLAFDANLPRWARPVAHTKFIDDFLERMESSLARPIGTAEATTWATEYQLWRAKRRDTENAFRQEIMAEIADPPIEYQYVLWLWIVYHYQTEMYDRKVCSARHPEYGAWPSTPEEQRLVNDHAKRVRAMMKARMVAAGTEDQVALYDRKAHDETARMSFTQIEEHVRRGMPDQVAAWAERRFGRDDAFSTARSSHDRRSSLPNFLDLRSHAIPPKFDPRKKG